MAIPDNFDELTDYGVHPEGALPFSSDLDKKDATKAVVKAGCVIVLSDNSLRVAYEARTRSSKTQIGFDHGPGAEGGEVHFRLEDLHTDGSSVSGNRTITHVFTGLSEATFVPRVPLAESAWTLHIEDVKVLDGALKFQVQVRDGARTVAGAVWRDAKAFLLGYTPRVAAPPPPPPPPAAELLAGEADRTHFADTAEPVDLSQHKRLTALMEKAGMLSSGKWLSLEQAARLAAALLDSPVNTEVGDVAAALRRVETDIGEKASPGARRVGDMQSLGQLAGTAEHVLGTIQRMYQLGVSELDAAERQFQAGAGEGMTPEEVRRANRRAEAIKTDEQQRRQQDKRPKRKRGSRGGRKRHGSSSSSSSESSSEDSSSSDSDSDGGSDSSSSSSSQAKPKKKRRGKKQRPPPAPKQSLGQVKRLAQITPKGESMIDAARVVLRTPALAKAAKLDPPAREADIDIEDRAAVRLEADYAIRNIDEAIGEVWIPKRPADLQELSLMAVHAAHRLQRKGGSSSSGGDGGHGRGAAPRTAGVRAGESRGGQGREGLGGSARGAR